MTTSLQLARCTLHCTCQSNEGTMPYHANSNGSCWGRQTTKSLRLGSVGVGGGGLWRKRELEMEVSLSLEAVPQWVTQHGFEFAWLTFITLVPPSPPPPRLGVSDRATLRWDNARKLVCSLASLYVKIYTSAGTYVGKFAWLHVRR